MRHRREQRPAVVPCLKANRSVGVGAAAAGVGGTSGQVVQATVDAPQVQYIARVVGMVVQQEVQVPKVEHADLSEVLSRGVPNRPELCEAQGPKQDHCLRTGSILHSQCSESLSLEYDMGAQ